MNTPGPTQVSRGALISQPISFLKVAKKESSLDRVRIDRANTLLKWTIREVLKSDSWQHHPETKYLLVVHIIKRLESQGFLWQVKILRYQLHFWLKNLVAPCEEVTD